MVGVLGEFMEPSLVCVCLGFFVIAFFLFVCFGRFGLVRFGLI